MSKNLIGFARDAVKNGSKIFVKPVAISEGGIVSFEVRVATVAEDGEVTLRDVTKTLKSVDGADGKFRGRPRTEAVLRAQSDGRLKASTVLARQIATALHGEGGKLKVQEL